MNPTCIPEPDALDMFLAVVVWALLLRGAWWVAGQVVAARKALRRLRGGRDQ